jgi:hypothetical protein
MKKLIAALAIGALTLTASPALAWPDGRGQFHGGRGFSGGHRALEAHRSFEHHGDFRRDHRGHVFIGVVPSFFFWGPAYPYYPPAYSQPAVAYAPPPPSYWYYCQSAGAYYPYVSGCPEGWVPVPAQ